MDQTHMALNTLVGMCILPMQLKTTLPELIVWKKNDKFIMEGIQKEKTFNQM